MKRVKYKYKVPKYNMGGAITQTGTMVGEGLAANPYNANGSVNDGRLIAGKAISRGAQGAGIGTMIMPGVGTAIGAGVGAVAGAVEGVFKSKKLMKERDEQMAAEAEQERLRQEEEARLAAEEAKRKEEEQKMYNQSYYAANPQLMAQTTSSMFAKGGLLPIASDMKLAKGPSHEEGGIDIAADGRVVAEIEGDEVLKGRRVYSDRLTMADGTTYADYAEKLGKRKGKFEKMAASENFRDRNTSERMLANIENELDSLFQAQEKSKEGSKEPVIKAYGGRIPKYALGTEDVTDGTVTDEDDPERFMTRTPLTTTGGHDPVTTTARVSGGYTGNGDGSGSNNFNWSNVQRIANLAVPFIDNVYNSQIINKTPEIPAPTKRVAYDFKATPMRTTVDINAQLANVNDMYRDFGRNIDAYTSNSNVARANKIVGYTRGLREKNRLYTDKYNQETSLVNQSALNTQDVYNKNQMNRQQVENYNRALTDKYNMDKVLREDNILKARAQNVSNLTEDAMNIVQDMNMKSLDQERMMTDALRYNDASGMARLIGTPTMDDMMKNPTYRRQVEQALEKAGQTEALEKFRKRYKK